MQENLTEQAYHILLKKIITAEYKPGKKISEKNIMEDLKIGRTPVREALLRLKQENLIKVVPQSGTYIAKIDLKLVLNARFVRINIEKEIMQEAAKLKLSELQIIQLKDIVQKQILYNKEKDFHNFFNYDDKFHEFFYQITGHEIIWKWLKQINIQFDRFRFLSLNLGTSSWENLIQEHKSLLDSVLNNDVKATQKAIIQHLHLVLDERADLLEKFPDYFENIK